MKNLTNSILEFWFDEKTKAKWYVKDKKFDEEIKLHFLEDYNYVRELSLEELTKNQKVTQILARIIILDQFPRNMFRGSKQSFATDEKALALTKFVINNKMDFDITHDELSFTYMPLMHSENLDDQELCIQKFEEIEDKLSVDYAMQHKKIIQEFGHFPHRNEILGRESTTKEIEFLKQPGSSF
jgi:uncharacterized protein (DUF924 family)